jgi:hypothetical protein
MSDVAGMEGVYSLEGDELRAEYADLVAANRMHAYGDTDEEQTAFMREMHQAILTLNGHVVTFIRRTEAVYLLERLPPGTIRREG